MKGIRKHSPDILTGIGIGGMFCAIGLAVFYTPKAIRLKEEKEREKEEKLTPKEIVQTTWECYIPAAATAVTATFCIVWANSINRKRTAALATAYSLTETALTKYREKVIEVIGEKKEEKVRDEIAKDELRRNPVKSSEVIVTGKGSTLCFDTISGRYFESDIEKLRKAENALNYRMLAGSEMYASLNDFYYEIGLKGLDSGNELGWNVNTGMLELLFSTQLSDDDRPCLVVDYVTKPKYDFQASLY